MDDNRSHNVPAGIARLYRTLWAYAAGHRPRLVAFLSLLFAAQAVRLAIPYYFGLAVNDLQQSSGQDLAQAGRHVALATGAVVLGWLLHGPARVMERFLAVTVRERFADSLYAQAANLPLSWHEGRHTGDVATRMSKAVTALFGFSQHQFVYLQNVVSLVGPLAAIAMISWTTGTAAVLAYVFIFILLVRFDRVMVRLIRDENAAERRWQAALLDGLANIATIRALRIAGPIRRLVAERYGQVSVPLRRNIVVNESKWCAIDLLNNAIRTGLVVLYGWLAWRQGGVLLLGSAVMVHQYSQQVGNVVGSMAGHWSDLVRYSADISGADQVLEALPAPTPAALPLLNDWRRVSVEHVTYHHGIKRGGGPALSELSLDIARGERIALVGESGSGKSTLLKVLAGLYQPERARIAVDGVACLGLSDLGGVATLIPQDAEIFEASLGFNITLGRDASADAVARACRLAGFDTVLAALPEGLDTPVGERGFDLSGGQRQRLALARGLLAARESSLLLLDEPTSALDPVTEARVTQAVLDEHPHAAIIASIHRLHLLPRFDRVVLMEAGRVVDNGSLEQLLARQPLFQALWAKSPASGFDGWACHLDENRG
ncbi:MAG: ABC transporter ATP-binding protein/permease [Magnetospirillum sp.]|nr:ABC transporter ATP-binding protein/permease [Magnetospirillum sp.]